MGKYMGKKINIFFAGDFCSKPSTSQITVSEELKNIIQSCDLKVVNFEVPLKPDIKLPSQIRERFFQYDDTPCFLRKLGFNLFSMANNHAFDWGIEGYKKTKAALGDESFGAGTYEEAYKPKIVDVNGIKIGFLGLSYSAYTGVFDDVARHDGYGCAYINDLRVNHDIIKAKKKLDYLFIIPHDGIEYIDAPLPETIARYRDFIDYGADGVFAAHPHCPQGWETYKDKPIFYSLGNFLFNSKEGYDFKASKPHWYEGLCVVLSIMNGSLSWEILNTKNVNNRRIEIDHKEDRNRHNELICSYLKEVQLYYEYLLPVLKKQVEDDIGRIEQVMYPQNVIGVVKALIVFLARKITKRTLHREVLLYMLKDDLKRSRLFRIMNL